MRRIVRKVDSIGALAKGMDGKGTSATQAACKKWALAPEAVKLAFALLIAMPTLLMAQPESSRPNETSPTQKAPFTVVIRATRGTIQPGSPISVEVAVTNISNHSIQVQLPGPENPDVFEVRDSKGNLFAPFARSVEIEQGTFASVAFPDLGPGSTSSATVEPGKSVAVMESLPDIFKLKRPDKYSIIAHRSDGFGGLGSVTSNATTVTVIP